MTSTSEHSCIFIISNKDVHRGCKNTEVWEGRADRPGKGSLESSQAKVQWGSQWLTMDLLYSYTMRKNTTKEWVGGERKRIDTKTMEEGLQTRERSTQGSRQGKERMCQLLPVSEKSHTPPSCDTILGMTSTSEHSCIFIIRMYIEGVRILRFGKEELTAQGRAVWKALGRRSDGEANGSPTRR